MERPFIIDGSQQNSVDLLRLVISIYLRVGFDIFFSEENEWENKKDYDTRRWKSGILGMGRGF